MAAFRWVLKEQAYGFLSPLLHFLPGASSVVLCTYNFSLYKIYYTAVLKAFLVALKKFPTCYWPRHYIQSSLLSLFLLQIDYIISKNSRFDVFVKLIFRFLSVVLQLFILVWEHFIHKTYMKFWQFYLKYLMIYFENIFDHQFLNFSCIRITQRTCLNNDGMTLHPSFLTS